MSEDPCSPAWRSSPSAEVFHSASDQQSSYPEWNDGESSSALILGGMWGIAPDSYQPDDSGQPSNLDCGLEEHHGYGYPGDQIHQPDQEIQSSYGIQSGDDHIGSDILVSFHDSSLTSASTHNRMPPSGMPVDIDAPELLTPNFQGHALPPSLMDMKEVGAGFHAASAMAPVDQMEDLPNSDIPIIIGPQGQYADFNAVSFGNTGPWSPENMRASGAPLCQCTDVSTQGDFVRSDSNIVPCVGGRCAGLQTTPGPFTPFMSPRIQVDPAPVPSSGNPWDVVQTDTLGQASNGRYSEVERTRQYSPCSQLLPPNPGSQGSQSSSAPSPTSSTVSGLSTDSFSCPQCDTSCRGRYAKGNLARHMRGHNKKPIKCEAEGCNKFFERSDARLKHYRKRHPDIRSDAPTRRK